MHFSKLQSNLTEDEYNLVRHGYGRKYGEWSEAEGNIGLTQELIDKLGVLEFETDSSPFDELPDQFAGGIFVAKVGEKLYLVNTEGFSYSRYIANLTVVESNPRAEKLRRLIELAEEVDTLQQELFDREWVTDVHLTMNRVINEAEEQLEDR